MRIETQQLFLHRPYAAADIVEAASCEPMSFNELDWDAREVLQSLWKFSKISLLHRYSFAIIAMEEREYYLTHDDLFDDDNELVAEVEQMLTDYQIDHVRFDKFRSIHDDSEGEEHRFREWFLSQEESFELLWEKVTDEVFHLLFANRGFLMQFNESLAVFLSSGKIKIPREFLDTKGVISRQSHVPRWAKNAIYCRDQGRCVLCQRDLTGLLSTDRTIHYDHIVPLNLWGVNDPCNLQLLCEDCNLTKSGKASKTSSLYYPWWNT